MQYLPSFFDHTFFCNLKFCAYIFYIHTVRFSCLAPVATSGLMIARPRGVIQ